MKRDKWKKLVIRVPVEMHVSYLAEPGMEKKLLTYARHSARDLPYEQVTAGIYGTFGMTRKVSGKHR